MSFWDEQEKDYHKKQAEELKAKAKCIRGKTDDDLVNIISSAWRQLNEYADIPLTESQHERRKGVMQRLKFLTSPNTKTFKGEA